MHSAQSLIAAVKSRNVREKTSGDISRSSLLFLRGFSMYFPLVHIFTKHREKATVFGSDIY